MVVRRLLFVVVVLSCVVCCSLFGGVWCYGVVLCSLLNVCCLLVVVG